MTTNVPQPTFGPNGFIVPDDEAILAGRVEDIDAAFGGGMNPALESPQGQLATSDSAIISDSFQTFLKFTQQVDPAFADGRMQDAIARIYFIERDPARSTIVACDCSGANVTIPAGATAVAEDGNIYTCLSGGSIPAGGGTISLNFACNATGPIACPEGTLNRIFQTIPGWDSIDNPADGVIGRDVESRFEFQARRSASVAKNASGQLPAVRGSVLSVAGVLDAYVTENNTGSPVTIGSGLAAFTLVAKSLYVAAVGGADADVARAIWTKKAPGCAYNGGTSVVVQDTSSGYVFPFPSYTVLFQRPAALTVWFSINIVASPQVPANAAQLIQAAVVGAFAGTDGGPRAQIGAKIFATRFVSAIAALGPWAIVRSIDLGSDNTPGAVFTGSVAGTVLTVTAVASGTLVPGQLVTDTTGHLQPGSVLGTQISGPAGGTGTYNISPTQTVASETMTSLVADQDEVDVGIAQAPVTSAANVSVTAT